MNVPKVTSEDVLDFVQASSYKELALYMVGPVMALMWVIPPLRVIILVALAMLAVAVYKAVVFATVAFVRKVDYECTDNGGKLVAEVLQAHGGLLEPGCAVDIPAKIAQGSNTFSRSWEATSRQYLSNAKSATSVLLMCGMKSRRCLPLTRSLA